VPPLRMCPGEPGASAAHSQGPHARRGASLRAERARDSWALWSAKRGATVMGCDRGPRERCQATAGRFPARRVARPFQRRLASATRVWENLVRQQRPWARFFDTPACRRVRRSTRLRSGSPPCGGVGRSTNSVGHGHRRASRRPARWLWRASPGAPARCSPCRACGSRAPLKKGQPASARRATGGCPAPVPRVPRVRRCRHARRCARPRAQRGT
jgi:hypothetical protein